MHVRGSAGQVAAPDVSFPLTARLLMNETVEDLPHTATNIMGQRLPLHRVFRIGLA